MIKPIPKEDIVVRPFKTYKNWTINETELTPIFGNLITGSLFDPNTDEKSAGKYKRLVYSMVDTTYYDGSLSAEEPIVDTVAVLDIPQNIYGESIKRGTVRLIDGATTYTDDSGGNLKVGEDVYGNVFYESGVIVLTENVVSGSTLSDFHLKFRSTHTIFENEIFLPLLENEFNVSQNPTSADSDGYIKYDTIMSSVTSSVTNDYVSGGFGDYEKFGETDPTGSYLSTYITTIGLYDDDGNMVVVGKLPKPVKKLPDYPLNFIVRFDT